MGRFAICIFIAYLAIAPLGGALNVGRAITSLRSGMRSKLPPPPPPPRSHPRPLHSAGDDGRSWGVQEAVPAMLGAAAVEVSYSNRRHTRYYGNRGGYGRAQSARRKGRKGGSITNVLLIANVFCFGLQGVFPAITTAGAKIASQIFRKGQIYRLWTPMFLHGDVSHLLMNCLSLYNIGPFIENSFGPQRMLGIYLLSGIAGNIASCIQYPNVMGIGASGAVFGMVGAAGVFFFNNKNVFGDGARRGLESICRTVAINIIFGLSSRGIDNAAHIGGLFAGAALTALFGPNLHWAYDPYTGQAKLTDSPLLSLHKKKV